ncbi:MAG: calcium-binding protein [Candidatus Limnocylindrales bacterium]
MRSTALKPLALGTAMVMAAAAPVAADGHIKGVGEVTALIAEASTATTPEQMTDGQSGDTEFPYIGTMKALATVGEMDAENGLGLTGYPDGHAAWLADDETVRAAYQSESYATMSSETYPWVMDSGASFTGSHIHTIDYDRAGLAEFLSNDAPAADIVKGTGNLFSTVYNVFGDEVVPLAEGGAWGNSALPDGTTIQFAPGYELSNGDYFFQSFCGAFYEPADKYGEGIGFADDVWLNAEEWNIQEMYNVTDAEGNVTETVLDTNETMGLASLAVDIENGVAYTVPALGQTGYEKLMPMNPGHEDYVVIVAAGYNHDLEPAPLKIYVGVKGKAADGSEIAADANERDQFLARNGLLYGKLYGLALANEAYADLGIENVDPSEKMMDAYLTNPDAPDTFTAAFAPTSYQWAGWDAPVAVGQTEMALWQAAEEQPEGHTFFVGDSKTEHPAVDPDITRQRYVQNMTQEGALLGFDLEGLGAAFGELDGELPEVIPVDVTRILPAVDGALTLDVADKGVKHGGGDTHATWEDGQAKMVAPDGLGWIKAADADVLIVDEDSGNDLGERKYALVIDPETMMLAEDGMGHFLAMAGGGVNPRALMEASAYGGTFSDASSSEFSGTWNITGLVATKEDGSFYSMDELAGTGEQDVNGSLPLSEQVLIGVVQHRGESGGAVADIEADQGGQLFIFDLDLPVGGM